MSIVQVLKYMEDKLTQKDIIWVFFVKMWQLRQTAATYTSNQVCCFSWLFENSCAGHANQ